MTDLFTDVSSFPDLRIIPYVCRSLERAGWIRPTPIQQLAIPPSLEGRDVVGLAETGSGKTGAFLVPIIQDWILAGRPPGFALVLVPTRELAQQITDVAIKLGSSNNDVPEDSLVVIQLIGGEDLVQQALRLAWHKHNVIVATPGRLVEHITQSKDFARQQLSKIRHLVLDEADRMLTMAFADDIDVILGLFRPVKKKRVRPMLLNRASLKEQLAPNKNLTANDADGKFPHPQTYLYSATMTKDVLQLKRLALSTSAVVINASEIKVEEGFPKKDILKTSFPSGLWHFYLPLRLIDKPAVLLWLLQPSTFAKAQEFCNVFPSMNSSARSEPKAIVFCKRCQEVLLVAHFLKEAGCGTVSWLTGQMPHVDRKKNLNEFLSGNANILVATDVASRGLDVPNIELIVNYAVPLSEKLYRHRVGRTARSGCWGIAVTLVTRDSATQFLELESVLSPDMLRSTNNERTIQRWPVPVPNSSGRNQMHNLRRQAEAAWRKAGKAVRLQLFEKFRSYSDHDSDSFSSHSSTVSTSDSDADNILPDKVTSTEVELGKPAVRQPDISGSAGVLAAKQSRRLEKKRKRKRRAVNEQSTSRLRTGWNIDGEVDDAVFPNGNDHNIQDNLRFDESLKMKYLQTRSVRRSVI